MPSIGYVHITGHAMVRYRQRIRPGADSREAAIVLQDAVRRMTRAGERTHRGQALWFVNNPDMRLVTKHDPTVGMVLVTVLGPEEPWENEEPLPAPPAPVPSGPKPHAQRLAPSPSPPAPAPRPPKAERQRAHQIRQAAEQAAAAQRKAERAARQAATTGAQQVPKAPAPAPAQPKRPAEDPEAAALRRARREENEAGRLRNIALGRPTHGQREAARLALGPQCGFNAAKESCRASLDGYVSRWRRVDDGAGFCAACDTAMDQLHAELVALASGSTT